MVNIESNNDYVNLEVLDVDVSGEKFESLSFSNSSFNRFTGVEIEMYRVEFDGVKINSSNFSLSKFEGARIYKTSFIESKLSGSYLNEAFTTNFKMENCKCDMMQLRFGKCRSAEFINCNFQDADFQGTDFTDATFINCDLRNATFTGCNLKGCDFSTSNTIGINLNPKDLKGLSVNYEQAIYFSNFLGIIIKGN